MAVFLVVQLKIFLVLLICIHCLGKYFGKSRTFPNNHLFDDTKFCNSSGMVHVIFRGESPMYNLPRRL